MKELIVMILICASTLGSTGCDVDEISKLNEINKGVSIRCDDNIDTLVNEALNNGSIEPIDCGEEHSGFMIGDNEYDTDMRYSYYDLKPGKYIAVTTTNRNIGSVYLHSPAIIGTGGDTYSNILANSSTDYTDVGFNEYSDRVIYVNSEEYYYDDNKDDSSKRENDNKYVYVSNCVLYYVNDYNSKLFDYIKEY